MLEFNCTPNEIRTKLIQAGYHEHEMKSHEPGVKRTAWKEVLEDEKNYTLRHQEIITIETNTEFHVYIYPKSYVSPSAWMSAYLILRNMTFPSSRSSSTLTAGVDVWISHYFWTN